MFQAPFFFFSINENDQFVYLSPSVEQVLGCSADSQLGQPLSGLLDPKHTVNVQVKICDRERLKTGSSHSLLAMFGSDGSTRLINIMYYPGEDEGQSLVHALAQDVTCSLGICQETMKRFESIDTIHDNLSQREKQVLDFVLQGELNKIAAKKLSVSERTIEGIRARLVKKFRVKTIALLIRTVTEYEIIKLQIQHRSLQSCGGWQNH
ncbi:MAG: LuxR C-terminal-related transcriptional regulator [Mariniblastus sp.]